MLSCFDQFGPVTNELMTTFALGAVDRAGYGKDLATLFRCVPRCNQCATAAAGFGLAGSCAVSNSGVNR